MSGMELEESRLKFRNLVSKLIVMRGGLIRLHSLCDMLARRGYRKTGLVESLKRLDGFVVDEAFDTIRVNGFKGGE